MVVSDEIWSDLTLPGYQHIPTQSVSPDAKNRTIALYAPSKTFNLAGLVGSYHIVYNKMLRERLEKESALSHYDEMNVLSMHALTGAYTVLHHRGWDGGIGWQDGRPFHGPCHIRLNLALPHTLVEEACKRMKQYVFCD